MDIDARCWTRSSLVVAVAALGLCFGRPQAAFGHCDTMDGPVVMAARDALAKGDVAPVLMWVRSEDEPDIREAFAKTLAVREKGDDARELADMYFFETLVRIHRAGEGAPYTGLKPAGTPLEPAVAAADEAFEKGSVEHLVDMVTDAVAAGIRKRFAQAAEAKEHVGDSVEAGREFVERYVIFVHYVERLHLAASGELAGHAAAEPASEHGDHEH